MTIKRELSAAAIPSSYHGGEDVRRLARQARRHEAARGYARW